MFFFYIGGGQMQIKFYIWLGTTLVFLCFDFKHKYTKNQRIILFSRNYLAYFAHYLLLI